MLFVSNLATPHVSATPTSWIILLFALILTFFFLKIVVSARAAWIQADQNRYAGANKCLLWKAFASRGLGTNAASYVNDFTVPTGC